MLQEFKLQSNDQPVQDDLNIILSDTKDKNNSKITDTEHSSLLLVNHSYSKYWRDYAVKLSRALSSFLLTSEDLKSYSVRPSAVRSSVSVSSVYGELSIKWVMRVLLTVFPCIKACSNQNELPSHLR